MLRCSKSSCIRAVAPYTSIHAAVQQSRPLPNLPGDPTMLTAEQIIAAQKAHLETLFDLTGKAFEGVEKLVELNLQVAKASLGEAAETAKSALAAKDAQEFLALQAGLL